MYLISVNGGPESPADLSGVYRCVALHNPADTPMKLSADAVARQLTCPVDESLIERSTREALHRLIWHAATGERREYRFPSGDVVAVTCVPGTEYKERREVEYGDVGAASDRADVAVRRHTGVRSARQRRR
jgi:hypothetical protein